jgi:DNA-binding NarL/FixJ family response regulator
VEAVSVLIVDDQLPFRVAARTVVSRTDGFAVVDEVEDGDAVVAAVGQAPVDLVLMDVYMPNIDGIEATRQLLHSHPGVTVFLCSTYPLDDLPNGARDCGAAGYMRKEQLSPASLVQLWEARQEPGLSTI